MFDMKQFTSALKQIAEEKGIPEASVLETVEAALAAAYKRNYGKKGQIIKVKMDPETGGLDVSQIYHVVEGVDDEGYITGPISVKISEDRQEEIEALKKRGTEEEMPTEEDKLKVKFNSEKHILVEDAKKHDKKLKAGDELVMKLEAYTDFGRIAAQTAKQVVIQRLREAERDAIFSEYKKKEGELVGGTVQRKEGSLVFIDLGKTNGLLMPQEQAPGDNYRIGQRFRLLILKVDETSRGPAVLLSRAHPKLVLELFRVEVPEIDNGAVEVKSIAREAGSRTKIAVASKEEGVDPIGSLVGQKGVRVQTVINELSGEKIDIILWNNDPKEFIANSLSPAKIMKVDILDEAKKHALVEVSDDQFSLAIGKRGQNVRLAAKLTGWKIDVRSPKENMEFNQVEEGQETKDQEIVDESVKDKEKEPTKNESEAITE